MRNLLVVASITVGLAQTAFGQQPLNPYDTPAAAAGVVDPYGTEAIAPIAAPAAVVPTPGYYYPPSGYAAPVYSYPPPVYYVAPYRPRRVRAMCVGGSCTPQGKARFFGVGAHFSVLGIDQQINGHDVLLGGAGVQLKFRTRGRFGLEGSLDVLHGSFDAPSTPTVTLQSGNVETFGSASSTAGPYFHVGNVTRDSIPVSLSAMVYIFPNTDERHFNLYFLGGLGVIDTTMGLTDENGNQVKQGFTEFEAHLGLGAELRFRWLALQADVRGMALARDDSSAPGSYYQGVDGGPVPKTSSGVHANLGATIWF